MLLRTPGITSNLGKLFQNILHLPRIGRLVNWNDGILLQKHEPDTHQFPDVAAEATHTPPGGRVGHQGVTGVS